MPYQPPEHPALLLAAILTSLGLLWLLKVCRREAEGEPRVTDTDPEDPMP